MKIYFLIFISLFSFACRFVAPGSSQTAALESKGAFSSGTPAWAKLPKEKRSNTLPSSSGIMSRTHTIPSGMSLSSSANASSSTRTGIGRGLLSDERKLEEGEGSQDWRSRRLNEVKKDKSEDKEETSKKILDEIEETCTGREKEVLNALKTTSRQKRIEKLVSLSRKCPQSVNIWLWLAKDYKNIRRYSDARRCLQAVFVLDPENEKARELYSDMNKSSGENTSK